MSAQPPTSLEGTHAPSQIELLWERYRPLVWTIVAAIALAMAGNYAWKYFQQKETNKEWSGLSQLVGLDEMYAEPRQPTPFYVPPSLTDALRDSDLAELEQGLSSAIDAQKPYLLLAIARKAMQEEKWDRAVAALDELESKYPNHVLVKTSDYPVQVRKPADSDAEPTNPPKKPELEPAVQGSPVSMMRQQIEAARSYATPEQFARIEPPADAPKVQFTFSNGASFVVALMPEYAPKHIEAFLSLAEAGHWVGMAVDEIIRPNDLAQQPREMHLGFASTKDDDRTKWITTEPAVKPVEFEASKLSHFAGAVSGRVEADDKSSADRFWIVADDAPRHDGERTVFGYVVEGLDQVARIAELSMSAQEEQRGRGRPAENVRITEVKKL